jgi:hypothetical protein
MLVKLRSFEKFALFPFNVVVSLPDSKSQVSAGQGKPQDDQSQGGHA